MNSKKTNACFNDLYNRMNGIYRSIAKKYNLSECQFWILYALSVENRPLTQTELRSYLIEPKQTIHSAMHKMLDDEIIVLQQTSGKKKYFTLSEKGKLLADKTVNIVIFHEEKAFDTFTNQEREMLIHLFEKYIDEIERLEVFHHEDTTK